MIEVRELTNQTAWEQFILSKQHTLFVQSPAYITFYQQIGERGWIFGVYDEERLVGGSVVVSTHAKRGNFLYLPYGPVFDMLDGKYIQAFFNFLKQFARQEHYHFIRCSPFIVENADWRNYLFSAGFRQSPLHVLAEYTWLLDVSKQVSEETLLQSMNKNHRNLIRRCEKEGVRVEMRTDPEAVTILNDMLDVTAKKHNFSRFSRTYIEQEFSVFAKNDQAVVFIAYLPDGQIDAAAIIMFYGSMACYRHSASYYLDKRFPTSYLIQWEVIKEARKRGMKLYNFWGIAPKEASSAHPFFGITHFKKGFGGFELDLLPCHDALVSNLYWITWIIESIRKIRRGF